MKILYITTIGVTLNFFKSFIQDLKNTGNEIHVACNDSLSQVPNFYNELGCKKYSISCTRSPFNFIGIFKAIREIKSLVEEQRYDIVHCHTPIAALCTRLACIKARKKGTKVFYTAHGFHFYNGAPLKNWLIYYPVEKFCSYFTDVLITINQEDYALAKKRMKAKRVEYVPGVGIDLAKFARSTVDKTAMRKQLGVPSGKTLLLSVGELNKNKNHETVIRAIKDLDVYYVIVGEGDLKKYLQSIIDELGMSDRVKLLGFRNDVGDLYEAADIYIMPSYREGLSVALMEAMASGLPILCSRIRGNTDLIDEKGGRLFNPYSIDECIAALHNLQKEELNVLGKENSNKIKQFSATSVIKCMKKLYGLSN